MSEKYDMTQREAHHFNLLISWKKTYDPQAAQTIIDDFLPYFHKKINSIFRGKNLSTSQQNDLRQECVHAVMIAMDRFDPEKGDKFTPFLISYVDNALRQYILNFRNACRIGVSSHERRAYYAAQKMRYSYMQNGDGDLKESDVSRISKNLDIPYKTAQRAVMLASHSPENLDAISDTLGHNDIQYQFEDDFSLQSAMAVYHRLKQNLPQRSQDILQATLLDEKEEDSYEKMGRLYNLSPRRVRQIQAEALSALKAMMEEENLCLQDIF